MATTVAEQLVNQLVAAGVRRIYGIVGDSLNPVVDAVRRTDGIDWVHVRHEEAAAFAAAAEATVTGRLAVCAGSCGPGNLHLINGLYDANRSRVPVLAIASHIPTGQIGTQFFQETHPDRLFTEASVFSEMISTGEQVPRVTRSAIQHALHAPGVAVLTLPGDVADHEVPGGDDQLVVPPTAPGRLVPAAADVAALARAINEAKKVTLFVGAGARGAREGVLELADLAAAPVGHSLRGKEVIQYDNPFDVGMTGLLGYGACQDALDGADLLVLIGTDFPYSTFLPDVRTAQIDDDARHLGRRTPVELPVHGDVAETMRLLVPQVHRKKNRRFLEQMLKKHESTMSKVVGAYTRRADKLRPIHPEYAAALLDEAAADDAVFTVDTGMDNVWAARYITPNGRRRVIGSFLHGSMANALPHAIGAAFANPGRQVVAMVGDGGLSMLLGELITVRAANLPVKIVVFNNATLGMVKLEMIVEGLPDHATDSPPVDYRNVARAVGIPAVRVEDPADLRKALTDGLARPGPALIDIVTDPNALSIPPSISGEQIRGFATAMTKQIFGGGAGEVVAMARSNLRNIPRP
ncbi:pyruvate dehydrogenase [Georgenia sp. TF02-10]|uniref:pyruvate dehydrogenase n=1 Tax=Georgenia sp. TF02-10 TaxID=2917725 RepID=UPI001FA71089|nr:pyruvate dehydrogenase [Georgenia sp. TF02-10]UNX55132.1 pyruvate dehydrogenase [Georgenia sp. TF02-10]